MVTDTSVAALLSQSRVPPLVTIDDYDPTTSGAIKGSLVFTGYFAGSDTRVEFFYEFPAGQSPTHFEQLLKEKNISALHLFSMFCAGWKESGQFSKSGIDTDFFTWVPTGHSTGYNILHVNIHAIDNDSAKFGFQCKRKSTHQTEELKSYAFEAQKATEDPSLRIKSAYVADSVLTRKKIIYRRAHHVNGDNVPAVPVRDELLQLQRRRDGNVTFAEKVNQSIKDDPLFPEAIRQLIDENNDELDVTALHKKNKIKKIVKDSLDDADCRNLKLQLSAALEKGIAANACDVGKAIKTLEILERNSNFIDSKIYATRHEEHTQTLRLEKLKEEKLKKYTEIKNYLEKSMFPYMKQGAIAYLLLAHIVDFLYDDREVNPEQELYKIADDWMMQYSHDHLMNHIEFDRVSAAIKKYELASTAKANLAHNSYGEKLYNEEYVADLVHTVHDLVEVQDAFIATPPDQQDIYFSEDSTAGIVSIKVGESGFQLQFKRDEFVTSLRKQKLQAMQKKLMTAHTQSVTSNVQFLKNPDSSFKTAMNGLDDGGVLSSALSVSGSDIHLFAALSVEEKISWLVSLWIIECRFYSDDYSWTRTDKIKIFKMKVDDFLNRNCSSESSLFNREHLLETIAFYIAKNTGERFKNFGEADVKTKRLSIEYRKEMIKAIYDGKLPNADHQKNDGTFTAYVEALASDVNILDTKGYEGKEGDPGYLKAYYLLTRPYNIAWNEDDNRNELVKLTNLLMALNNASFLDSKGVRHDGNAEHKNILERRQCLIELMFHVLVDKITPFAEKAYAPKPYQQLGATLLNAGLGDMGLSAIPEYNPESVEKIASTAFKHVDALLGKSAVTMAAKETKPRKKKAIAIVDGPDIYAQSHLEAMTGRDNNDAQEDKEILKRDRSVSASSSGSSAEDVGFAERSRYYVAEIEKLKTKLNQIDAVIPVGTTLRAEILDADRMKSFHVLMESLEGPANAYLKNSDNRNAFDQACKTVNDKFDAALGSLSAELASNQSERSEGFDKAIQNLRIQIDEMEESLKLLIKDISVDEFVQGWKIKVDACAENKKNYVEGKMPSEEIENMVSSLSEKMDQSFALEKLRIEKLKEERKTYCNNEIEQLFKRIETIRNTFYPEASDNDETSEMETGKHFGKTILNELIDEFSAVKTMKAYYESGEATSKTCLDNSIVSLSEKIATFEEGLTKVNVQVTAFNAVKVKFNEYLSGSLIKQHQEAFATYQSCKATIDGRGFWATVRSMCGFAAEKAENLAFEAAKHQVKVLAIMISLDEKASVTEKSLSNLDIKDLEKLQNNLRTIYADRLALESRWFFKPAKKIGLYKEAEKALEDQIWQIKLKQRVLAIQAESNPDTRAALVASLMKPVFDDQQKSVLVVFMEKLFPAVTTALTALSDLFSSKTGCDKKFAEMKKKQQQEEARRKEEAKKAAQDPVSGIALISKSGGNFATSSSSESAKIRSVSNSNPVSPVLDEAQRNRSVSLGASSSN